MIFLPVLADNDVRVAVNPDRDLSHAALARLLVESQLKLGDQRIEPLGNLA